MKQSSFTPVNGCRIIVGAAPFFFSWTLIAFLDGDVLTYELLESLKRLCLFNMMRASAALWMLAGALMVEDALLARRTKFSDSQRRQSRCIIEDMTTFLTNLKTFLVVFCYMLHVVCRAIQLR